LPFSRATVINATALRGLPRGLPSIFSGLATAATYPEWTRIETTFVEKRAGDPGRLLVSPLEVFGSAWRNRGLILRLARREIEARYRGSMLGILWSLVVPLALLTVYTIVFSTIFASRWEIAKSGSKVDFALVLFSGLILFNVFAETANRAPGLMLENVTYIKRIVFPLQVLPWVSVTVALFNATVSFCAFVIGFLLMRGIPPASAALFPLMLVPLVLLAVGCSWFLSSLGVYLRDVQQFVPVIITVLLYLNPIFFPMERLPGALATVMQFSPIAVAVEGARAVLFGGASPDWPALGLHVLLSWVFAWGALMWFLKTRKGFADVV
jgi:lipopolysaccharide transport system permease protein